MTVSADDLEFTQSPVAAKDLHRIGQGRQAELFAWPSGGVVKLFRSSEWVPPELKAAALADLDRLPDGAAVCHWDFHPANVIETSGGPRIIDWAGVRRGHRLADVARTLMVIRDGALPPGAPLLVRWFAASARSLLAWRYLGEYRRRLPFADSELTAWTRVSLTSRLSYGFPEERQHLLALIAAC